MRTNISVSLDKELIETLKALAENEGRNFSNMIEYIIRQYLAGRV